MTHRRYLRMWHLQINFRQNTDRIQIRMLFFFYRTAIEENGILFYAGGDSYVFVQRDFP